MRGMQTHDRDLNHPILCRSWYSAYHRTSSGLTRDAATTALHCRSWICNGCTVFPSRPSTAAQPRTEVLEPPCRISKPTLRILQWNADGLSTKVQQQHDRLAEFAGEVATFHSIAAATLARNFTRYSYRPADSYSSQRTVSATQLFAPSNGMQMGSLPKSRSFDNGHALCILFLFK